MASKLFPYTFKQSSCIKTLAKSVAKNIRYSNWKHTNKVLNTSYNSGYSDVVVDHEMPHNLLNYNKLEALQELRNLEYEQQTNILYEKYPDLRGHSISEINSIITCREIKFYQKHGYSNILDVSEITLTKEQQKIIDELN